MNRRHSTFRQVAAAFALLGVALIFTGCGTLNRSIGFTPLTESEMKYAATMPAVQAPSEGERRPNTVLNVGQYAIPAFPVYIYMKRFTRMQEAYDLTRSEAVLLFLAGEGREMVFDKKGLPVVEASVKTVLVAGGVDTITDYHGPKGVQTKWRVRILEIPIISAIVGPCFGFGTGYAKVLWIPFVNDWPDAAFRRARPAGMTPPPTAPEQPAPVPTPAKPASAAGS